MRKEKFQKKGVRGWPLRERDLEGVGFDSPVGLT